jgi:CheY-like chemotaxis protein
MPPQSIVLVCENWVFGELICDILADQCYQRPLCTALGHAYDLISHVQPQLVLLDIFAPAPVAEWQLVAHLRNDPHTARIPIIVCTTNPAAARLEPYAALAGCTILEKPFLLDELAALIRAQIGPPR